MSDIPSRYRPVSIPVTTNHPQHLVHVTACQDCGSLVVDQAKHDLLHVPIRFVMSGQEDQ